MDSLFIDIPSGMESEKRYAMEEALRLVGLSVNIVIREVDGGDYVLYDEGGRSLRIADVFFRQAQQSWLKESSLPGLPLDFYELTDGPKEGLAHLGHKQIPVIFGRANFCDGYLDLADSAHIKCGIDIIGTTFFLLSNYEEIVKEGDRDRHGRFPATSSFLFSEGLLERPVLNEYLELLAFMLTLLWPSMGRSSREYAIHVSHDVDAPFSYFYGSYVRAVARQAFYDIGHYRSPTLAFENIYRSTQVRCGRLQVDPYNTFSWLINVAAQKGYRPAFYFIAGRTDPVRDADYDIDSHEIESLMRNMIDNGCELGLHISYAAYTDDRAIRSEFDAIKKQARRSGYEAEVWGCRQHYLRWEASASIACMERAGLDYDTTCGFADHVGFKVGLCYEYYPYDLVNRRKLNIREKPLIAMDVSLIDKSYMGLGLKLDVVAARIECLKEECRKVSGDFTMLWHNSMLVIDAEKEMFLSAVS